MVVGVRATVLALALCAVVLSGCAEEQGRQGPGNAAALPPKTIFEREPPTPGAAAVVTAGTAAVTESTTVVQWSVPEGEPNTLSWVEYGVAGSLDRESERKAGPGNHQVALTDLLPGKAYTYRIIVLRGEDPIRSAVQGFATKPLPEQAAAPESAGGAGELRVLSQNVPQVRIDGADITWEVGGGAGTVGSVVEYGSTESLGLRTDAQFGRGGFIAILNGLSPGQTYYYRILARDDGGSATSPVQSFTTPMSPQTVLGTAPPLVAPAILPLDPDDTPPVIRGISKTPSSPTTIGFYWDVADDRDFEVTSYVQYGKGDSLDLSSAQQYGLGPRFSYIRALEPATQYSFRIVARDLAGNIAFSPVQTFVTADPRPPSCDPPLLTDVQVPAPRVTANSIHVEWRVKTCPFLSVLSWVQYAPSPPGDALPEFKYSGRQFTGEGRHISTLLDLPGGTWHTLRVVAVDAAGQVTESDPVKVYTLDPPRIVQVFVDPSTVLTDRFTVRWTAIGPKDAETWVEFSQAGRSPVTLPTFRLDKPMPGGLFSCDCSTTLQNLAPGVPYIVQTGIQSTRGSVASPQLEQWTAKVFDIDLREPEPPCPPNPARPCTPPTGPSVRNIWPDPHYTMYEGKPHMFRVVNNFNTTASWELWSDDDCDPETPIGAPKGRAIIQSHLLTPASVAQGGSDGEVPRLNFNGRLLSITLPAGTYCMQAVDVKGEALAKAALVV